jgi:hypothetical protein
MKTRNDQEIKRLLEEQLTEDENRGVPRSEKDAALYQILFTALADEPDNLKHTGLAEAVLAQIKIKQQRAEASRYNALIAAVIVGGLVFSYFAIAYISPALLNRALSFIYTYKWIFIFIALCFAIIEIADKNLVKRKLVNN